MCTQAQFRRLALALPDVVEGAHQGHPDFRAQGLVFASLHPDGAQGMVKVPPGVQQRLVAGRPDAFASAAGGWGRAGCTIVSLADVSEAELRDALAEAWQFAGAAAAQRRAKK